MTDRPSSAGAGCPCGIGAAYGRHCGRLHAGASAVTAEELMRSRYSAHVRGDAAYLERTWQPANRPKRIELDPEVLWLGLEVHRTEHGQALDAHGVVEFTATYERQGKRVEMREISRFARDRGQWVYVDGIRPL